MKASSSYGPIMYRDMYIEANEHGIQAKDYTFDMKDLKKPQPWKAKWIWLDNIRFPGYQESRYTVFCESEGKKHGVALFRKEFSLTGKIKSVVAWVSADVKYRMHVNGQMVGRGPAEVGGDYGNTETLQYWFYDQYDLTGSFSQGRNIITAEVALQPDVQADYSMGHGGFLFEAVIEYTDGNSEVIHSDDTWKGILNPASVSVNHYDARQEPGNWMNNDYDDSEWPFVLEVDSASKGRWSLIPREIPPLMETKILPVRVFTPFEEFNDRLSNSRALLNEDDTAALVSFGAPLTFWLDFGKMLAGRIYLKVNGAAGTVITIAAQEIIGKTERLETYILKGGLQEYETLRLQSVQYLQVTVSNLTGAVEIAQIGVNFTSYPVSYAGEFKCSDDILNRVYDAGRWSNQLCMQAYHMDSPIHQEALGCTGDYMIESLMNYYTFGDRWLTRLDILRTARLLEQKKGFMFHTSYSLLWLQMLVDYHRYTGEGLLLKDLASTVYPLLERFENYRGESGLIENAPNYMFMDWVPVGDYNLHHPPKIMGQAYMTAFYYKALKNGVYLCNTIGEKVRAAHYGKLADTVKTAFNRNLWVDEKGLYCDGRNSAAPSKTNDWLPEDIEGVYFSQHTNALAVLYDIAPKEMHVEIMNKIFEDTTLTQAQPYFMHFILEAAAHAGVFGEYGFAQMRRWKSLLDENSSSLKEVWAGFDCDYSHAWGGTPTYQLPSKVLGVVPLLPGFDKIGINPVFGDLVWARGKVPTSKGAVQVEWVRREDGIDLNVTTPGDVPVEIGIPKLLVNSIAVTLNGKKLLQNKLCDDSKQCNIVKLI